jgi:4-aminobutyrate aminotransferase-like enzyme
VWDTEDQAYLDLQMWYSAVNFGYANPRLNNALKQQIDTLPQIASQYLHKGKIELSEMIAVDAKKSSASTVACTSTSAARSPSRTR